MTIAIGAICQFGQLAMTALDASHAGRTHELAGNTSHTGTSLADNRTLSHLIGRPTTPISETISAALLGA